MFKMCQIRFSPPGPHWGVHDAPRLPSLLESGQTPTPWTPRAPSTPRPLSSLLDLDTLTTGFLVVTSL